MSKALIALVAGMAAVASTTASASPVDNYASAEIRAAKLVDAVALLEPRVAQAPDDESALINLAVAYRRIGRVAEARALYERVLTLDDVVLDAADGRAISAHDVARRGLARGTLLSSR